MKTKADFSADMLAGLVGMAVGAYFSYRGLTSSFTPNGGELGIFCAFIGTCLGLGGALKAMLTARRRRQPDQPDEATGGPGSTLPSERGSWASLVGIAGIVVAALSGNAIARHAGFGEDAWLVATFAFGILLVGHASMMRVHKRLADVESELRLLR
jgi:type IV secretory pathway TrbD component